MGLVKAQINLRNPIQTSLKAIDTSCLVDSGALHLCLPEHLAIQLGYDLAQSDTREVTTADGKKRLVPYIGPIQVKFQTRSCFVGPSFWEMNLFLDLFPWKTWI